MNIGTNKSIKANAGKLLHIILTIYMNRIYMSTRLIKITSASSKDVTKY